MYRTDASENTWFTTDSLAAYLECAGESRFKEHAFQPAELLAALGPEACDRIRHAHALPAFNADDPFTLEPPTAPVCRFRAAAGAPGVYQFSAVELARYLRATGCFKNPLDNSPFPPDAVRLVGMLSGDATLGEDMGALEIKRARLAEEAQILEFLGSEVVLRFNDMLSLANEDENMSEELEVLRVGFILPDMHVAFVSALADLDALSRQRCTQALQESRDRLAEHKAEGARRHGPALEGGSLQSSKRFVIYKFSEMSLDSWMYASDTFRSEDLRVIKLNEVMRVHQVLLEST